MNGNFFIRARQLTSEIGDRNVLQRAKLVGVSQTCLFQIRKHFNYSLLEFVTCLANASLFKFWSWDALGAVSISYHTDVL
jgi:hypothetical protein